MAETQQHFNIPKTMKAAIVKTHGAPLVIEDIPVPEPGYGEVLIKIYTSGVCHTDLHVQEGDWFVKSKLPVIPGHEGAGIVVKLGSGVTTLKVGDRVGSAWLHDSCGGCEHCLQGWETVCSGQHQTGFASDGCFAEYVVALANYVGRIPDSLSFEQASPILCAGVTTYKGLKETEVKPGQWVAIVGASGGLGHVAMQYAKSMGMKVIAVDFGEDKIQYCIEHGALCGVDVSKPDVEKRVKDLTNGGPHGIVVLAPSTKAFEQAAKYLRPRGIMVGIGLPPGEFKVDVVDWILNRKTLRGSIVGTRWDLQEALTLAASGGIRCDVQERKLDEINQILTDLKKGVIKGRVVLRLSN
jgi:propanol-preferring alcohol dehydrogenase